MPSTHSVRFKRCPYCGESVDEEDEGEMATPPDERTGNQIDYANPDDDYQQDTRPIRVLFPCGHIFEQEHIDVFGSGEYTQEELASSVVNPKA